MQGKKTAAIVVLLAILIGGVATIARRVVNKPPPPSWVLREKVQKIDVKSLELVTEPTSDWYGKYAPDSSGRFKNPKTGEYTMVDPIKCAACGQLIPPPDSSAAGVQLTEASPASPDAKGPPPQHRRMRYDPAAFARIRREYRCPKCGKSPFTP